MPTLRHRGLALLLAASAALSACNSDKVPLDTPTPAAADDAARCQALIKALPDTIAHELRRPVDPDNALGAAWGDPAIELVCGGAMPPGFDNTAACDVANGVGWYADPALADNQAATAEITTVGYRPIVTVRIPGAHRPEAVAAAMVELAPMIKRHLRLVKRCV